MAAQITAAKPRPMMRQPPRWLPRLPVRTTEPVSKKLLWSKQRRLRMSTCWIAIAGAAVRRHWRNNRAAVWSCVPPAPPSIVKIGTALMANKW